MNIRADDIGKFSERLNNELAVGNSWVIYDQEPVCADLEGLYFFQSNKAAFIYLVENSPKEHLHQLVAIQPLHNALQQINTNSIDKSTINYYHIDDKYFEVDVYFKNVPHAIALDQMDQLPTKVSDRSTMESQQLPSERRGTVPYENFNAIKQRLTQLGYEPDFYLLLENMGKTGGASHMERTFEHLENEMISYLHRFSRNDDGLFAIESVNGTLYYKMEVNHAIINGVNTKDIEIDLRKVDWDIEGFRFLSRYNPVFQKLCEDPEGKLKAVQLFNNYVPYSWDKPDFIYQAENELKLYPMLDFPGNTSAQSVYLMLKKYQRIDNALSEYSIPNLSNATRRATIVEQLVNDKTASFTIPGKAALLGAEVVVSWDKEQNSPKFIANGIRYYLDEYLVKSRNPEAAILLKELEKLPLRHINDLRAMVSFADGLLEGKRMQAHLEREMFPADHIKRFLIYEFRNPDGNGSYRDYDQVFSHPDYGTALSFMNNIAKSYLSDEARANSKILLIGEFNGKLLEFDPLGKIKANTGYAIAAATDFSPDGYCFQSIGDPTRLNILVEQIYIEKEKESLNLRFTDDVREKIKVDQSFWKRSGDKELNKAQAPGDNSLLPKFRHGPGNGMSI